MKEKNKLYLETVFDYDGYPDYYSGHGHAFTDKDVVACIEFEIPITYQETVRDIIDMIIEQIDSVVSPIQFLGDAINDVELQEQIENLVTDENIEKSIRAELIEGTKDTDKFFETNMEITEDLEEDIFMDSPCLIGYIHVWKE